jgi:transcriptional regulator with XRE-family HTH domain
MLPLCDRVIHVSRDKYLPAYNRKIPVPRHPTTIGGHLRKRRLQLKLFQSEAARKLGVSTRTLSLWECDRIYPTWHCQLRIRDYLGHDPFTDPTLGRPTGNETKHVAFLAPGTSGRVGDRIRSWRLQRRKSRKQLAQEMGISPKTLWNWEHHRRQPSQSMRKALESLTGLPKT